MSLKFQEKEYKKNYNEIHESRFKQSAIEQAIKKAYLLSKKKHPNKKHYFLTDTNIKTTLCKTINNLKKIKSNFKEIIFICYYENDEKYLKILKIIKKKGSLFFSLPIYNPVARYLDKNINVKKALQLSLKESKNKLLSHFDGKDFQNIMQAIEITKNLEGVYIEIGVFMGTSANAALNYMSLINLKRKCYFLDTYEGFNYEKSRKSIDQHWSETHELLGVTKTINKIKNLLNKFKIPHKIIQNNICKDNLPKEIKKIAVCNLDVDIYDATLDGLKKVAPLIVKGGIIIAGDDGHTPALGGAALALQEFLGTKEGNKFIPIYLSSGQRFLIKK